MATTVDEKLKQQIVESLNLSGLTAEQKDEIISGLMDNAFNNINMTILDLLTEEEKKELEKKARIKKNGFVLKYLNSKIKDFSSLSEEITRETIKDFKRLRSAQVKP